MALPSRYPRVIVKSTRDWYESLKDFARSFQLFQNDVVEYTQQIDEPLNILYYEQSAEPTLSDNGTACFWKDTDDSKVYLVFKNSDGQKKVELT